MNILTTGKKKDELLLS